MRGDDMIKLCGRMRIVLGDLAPEHVAHPQPINTHLPSAEWQNGGNIHFDSSPVWLFLWLKSHEPVIAGRSPPVLMTNYSDFSVVFARARLRSAGARAHANKSFT